MERFQFEPFFMGLCIGLAALLLNSWVGDASWNWRILALLIVGGVLCVAQYWLARRRGGG